MVMQSFKIDILIDELWDISFGQMISCLFAEESSCSSRKYSYPPHGWSMEIPKGWGFLQLKLEFPEVGEGDLQTNTPFMGGVCLLTETTH